MTKTDPKEILIKRSVKHVFSGEERATKSEDLVRSLAEVQVSESEFDSVKASYKAKIEAAGAQVDSIAASLRAGFEMRIKECRVEFDVPAKRKTIMCVETKEVVAVEDMTADDLQTELQLAESVFEERTEIALWQDAGPDKGLLVVGLQNKRWFSALRISVGKNALTERLDAEQKAFKERRDAITNAAQRARTWLKDTLKDLAKGFTDPIEKAVADAVK